jgi:hypothetical protein
MVFNAEAPCLLVLVLGASSTLVSEPCSCFFILYPHPNSKSLPNSKSRVEGHERTGSGGG